MANMARWWWFVYQWNLSLYLYMLIKEPLYELKKSKKYSWEDFSLFIRKMKKFQKKCIKTYWKDFNLKIELLVEWEEKCLDDITLISTNKIAHFDNNIFIQVKTKGNWNIWRSDWILKAIKNFLNNINFQKDKDNSNIIFYIFTNKDLTRPLLKEIENNNYKLYIPFINYIISNSNIDIYPKENLNHLKWELNNSLVEDIINNQDILISKYNKIYSNDYLNRLIILIRDLKIIFYNLDIITKIDENILVEELKSFHSELVYFQKKEIIEWLCKDWTEIKTWSNEFKRYEKYKYTYFKAKNWWQLINEIDTITEWKFLW